MIGRQRMQLFHLSRRRGMVHDLDTVESFVVAARDETDAREVATTEHGDEGFGIWLDKQASDCIRIGVAVGIRKTSVICRAFRNG